MIRKLVLLSVLSMLFFTGCRVVGGGVRVNLGHNLPPAHAPAHGRRSHHLYHYYPDAGFYFDVSRNGYFYLDSNASWTFSINLPLRLRSQLHSGYVNLETDSARPYLKYKYHKTKYSHKKYKRKYKARRKHKNTKKRHRRKHRDDEDKHHRRPSW